MRQGIGGLEHSILKPHEQYIHTAFRKTASAMSSRVVIGGCSQAHSLHPVASASVPSQVESKVERRVTHNNTPHKNAPHTTARACNGVPNLAVLWRYRYSHHSP